MRDAHWRQGRGSPEPRPARQASNAEALLAVAEAALANPDGSRTAGERYQADVCRPASPRALGATPQPSSLAQLWMRVKVVPHLPGWANSASASRRSEASSPSLNVSSSRGSSATLN
jgi:hypothetical protein